MDANRFDALTKRLARAGTSRRTLLKGLFGGLAGGVTGAVAHEQADAVICRQGGVLCAKDAQCCSGSCVDYHCTCEAGEVACGPRCCAASQVCLDATHGQCCTATTCQAGQCGIFPNGCGGMVGCACSPDEQCSSGQCVPTTTTTSTTSQPTTTTAPPTTTTTAAPTTTTSTTTSTTTAQPTTTTTTTTTTAAPCLTTGAFCRLSAACCSGVCTNLGCCPVCPSGCTCRSTTEANLVCTNGGGSRQHCFGSSSQCPTGEFCILQQCQTLCPSAT